MATCRTVCANLCPNDLKELSNRNQSLKKNYSAFLKESPFDLGEKKDQIHHFIDKNPPAVGLNRIIYIPYRNKLNHRRRNA